MIVDAVERMYAIDDTNRFLEVTYQNGDKEILYFKDFSSGAMIENIVRRAKKLSIKRQIEGGREGHLHAGPPRLDPPGVPRARGPAQHDQPRRLGEDLRQEGRAHRVRAHDPRRGRRGPRRPSDRTRHRPASTSRPSRPASRWDARGRAATRPRASTRARSSRVQSRSVGVSSSPSPCARTHAAQRVGRERVERVRRGKRVDPRAGPRRDRRWQPAGRHCVPTPGGHRRNLRVHHHRRFGPGRRPRGPSCHRAPAARSIDSRSTCPPPRSTVRSSSAEIASVRLPTASWHESPSSGAGASASATTAPSAVRTKVAPSAQHRRERVDCRTSRTARPQHDADEQADGHADRDVLDPYEAGPPPLGLDAG